MLRSKGMRPEPNSDGHGLDRQLVIDPVDVYLRETSEAIDRLSREEIWAAVDMLLEAGHAGRRIYLIGNGGSAATASHMAVDLNKQACESGGPRLRAIALTDNVPLITTWGNDTDYAEIFARQLENHLEPDDVVVAISTSGKSENVLRALELAREVGAHTIGLTGYDGGAMRDLVDCCLFVPCEDIGQQESVHLALDHAITSAIQARLRPCG